MVILSAYFDESVTDLVFSGAGYIATTRQWVNFERDWLKLLQWAGMPEGEPFHMTDYESRAEGTLYEHWGDSKRKEFMQRAVGIIRRRVKVGISASLDLPAYNAIAVDPVRAEGLAGAPRASYGPYSFIMGSCLKLVENWCDRNGRNDPIAYIFESGAALSGHLGNALIRDHARTTLQLGLDGVIPLGQSFMALQAE